MATSKIDAIPSELKACDQWDCKFCPIAADLLRWIDELSARNAGLEFTNKQLREKLSVLARR